MSETKTEIASDTIKTANAKLAVDKAHFQAKATALAAEVELLKLQLATANEIIENDLKSDLIIKIQAASEYTETDLLSLTPSQLQTIEQTLAKGKNFETATTNYKSIRAGNAQANANLTVGDLYGKTPEEIRKMGGVM